MLNGKHEKHNSQADKNIAENIFCLYMCFKLYINLRYDSLNTFCRNSLSRTTFFIKDYINTLFEAEKSTNSIVPLAAFFSGSNNVLTHSLEKYTFYSRLLFFF